MHIPGHLAIAAIQYRLAFLPEQQPKIWPPLLLAALLPDAVDKSIGYIFHKMPNGRHYMHNIFSLAGFSVLVACLWGQTAGRAWFIGHLGHLLADSGGLVPWFFPLKKYPFSLGKLSFDPAQLIGESLFLGAVLGLLRLIR